MSRYFVNDPPIAIADPSGSENVITIRPRMDVGTQAKTRGELVGLDASGQAQIHGGSGVLALLIHNIVAWSGPDFDGVKLSRENICKLDPTDPHVELVINEIGERNRPKESPDQKKAMVNGSSNNGSSASTAQPTAGEQSATMTTISHSPSATAGRQKRSTD